MSIGEKQIKNIFIYAVPKFAGYFLSFITVPILTRILTPAEFGVVALAAMFPNFALSIFTLGMVAATQRNYFEYRQNRDKLDGLIISSQVFLYVMLVISSLLVFFLREKISKITIGNVVYGDAVFFAFLSSFFGYIISFYLILYQSMERAIDYAVFIITQSFIASILSLVFVWYFKMSYMGIIYGSFVASACVLVVVFFKFNKPYIYRYNGKILLENIKYGIQTVPESFTGFINKFFDKYMLNNMVSLSVVGIYNIGQSMGVVVFNIMNAVWSSFQPVFYKEIFDKGNDASESIGKMVSLFAYLTLLPVLIVILFAKEIVYILAPPSYYDAINVIIIVTCAMSTNVFGMFVGMQYAYAKKPVLVFFVTILGTISNVIANVILIPKFGLLGAAFSTLVSYFVLNGILTIIGQKLYRIKYEWRLLSTMFFLIFISTFTMLYFRMNICPIYLLYLVKTFLIGCYVMIGFHQGYHKLIELKNLISIKEKSNAKQEGGG